MKKIINGKLYNTETASHIATVENGCLPGDFDYAAESIYIKKTGEWFLEGYGGPMSYYWDPEDYYWPSGSNIVPLTNKAAKNWLVDNDFVDEYIKYFGEPEE